jgi:hypothetical protein
MKLTIKLNDTPTFPVDEAELLARLKIALFSFGYLEVEIEIDR